MQHRTFWQNRLVSSQLPQHLGELVPLKGWVQFTRKSKQVRFFGLRDGAGLLQVVLVQGECPDAAWEAFTRLNQETAVAVSGLVQPSSQGQWGVELALRHLEIVGDSVDFPITPKEHGPDFLLSHRHLWLRSKKQVSLFKVRDEVIHAIHDFFRLHHFTKMDSPILTQTVGEDQSGLFELEFHDLGKAYLAQTGQLYLEASIFAHGRVFCFGPTFRAEKSKTRRHLAEFWMLEAEMAFFDNDDNLDLQEDLIRFIVNRVLENCSWHLQQFERDLSMLERVREPFIRLDYDEAVEVLKGLGSEIRWGDDLGASDETLLGEKYQRPTFVMNYPQRVKAFYMKQHPQNPAKVKCADLIAPEGHGEVIGGSERETDYEALKERIVAEGLDLGPYHWYLDLRKYGSVPHSGFGIGLERLVGWLCGIHHIREAIPFPRMLERIHP